jgi:hypothetical protein
METYIFELYAKHHRLHFVQYKIDFNTQTVLKRVKLCPVGVLTQKHHVTQCNSVDKYQKNDRPECSSIIVKK